MPKAYLTTQSSVVAPDDGVVIYISVLSVSSVENIFSLSTPQRTTARLLEPFN